MALIEPKATTTALSAINIPALLWGWPGKILSQVFHELAGQDRCLTGVDLGRIL